jgi:hypothetical protein
MPILRISISSPLIRNWTYKKKNTIKKINDTIPVNKPAEDIPLIRLKNPPAFLFR